MASLKPLIMRANRLLGASLVEQGLVSIDDLDEANDRMVELMGSSSKSGICQVSLLSILLNEKKAVDESALLERLVEEHCLGLLDLKNIEFPDELRLTLKADECWATMTVPFDHVEDTHYLATAYYLSPAVRDYWEKKILGKVVWYAATVESLTNFLDNFDASAAVAGSN